jgi:phosphoglycolate phosphatase
MADSDLPFQAVLFDLDGTLIDSLEDIAAAANQALRECGYPVHPAAAYRQFVGEGVRMLFRRALAPQEATEEMLAALSAGFARCYEKHWNQATRPYPGIEELLLALGARGLALAVLSNKPDAFTQRCVAHYFPGHRFAAVQGQIEGTPRKPDPAGALQVARRAGAEAARVVYVGDSATDMQTAVRAGMYPVGVGWGFRQVAELVGSGAARVINAPAELLEIVDLPRPPGHS